MRNTLTILMLAVLSGAPFACAEDLVGETPNQDRALYNPASYRIGSYQPGLTKSDAARPDAAKASLPASWKWSLAPLAASQALDISSSYGMRELNPMLAGPQNQFGARAVMLKVSATAALIGVEYLIVKAHPGAARVFTKINWSGAALTTGFAAHNFAIR